MNSAPICSDIHSASFDLLRASEVKKLSVCHVTSTTTFESTGESKVGGLHDLRMGPLSNRDFCGTCGSRNECPGHIGHIELELPVFHPLFLGNLVRILKCCCWHCCCIRLSKKVCNGYVKRFESIGKNSNVDSKDLEIYNVNDAQSTDGIASNSYSLEIWEGIKREFLDKASKHSSCSSCGNSFKGRVKESQLGIGITLSWPEGSKPPVSLGSTWSSSSNQEDTRSEYSDSGSESGKEPDSYNSGDSDNQEEGSISSSQQSNESKKRKKHAETKNKSSAKLFKRSYYDDFSMNIPQEAKSHTKQGRGMITQHFQAFQIVPIIKNIWENNRKIFEFIFPICKSLGWEAFFMFTVPVSANKFRPLGMAVGRNISLLHPRTSGLLEILTANDRLKFYVDLQRKENTNESSIEGEESSKTGKGAKTIKEEIEVNSNNLISYVSSLQEKVNMYLDQSKSFKPSSAPPGIRQWLEKKAGVIRQKMMGKRVNYSARTVIGPDPYLDTNEIGVPLMFALNLTIPERVGTHNVSLMANLVENGPNLYPGANKLLLGGILYDLSRLDQNQRKAKARLLLSSVLSASNPFLGNHHPIVYRHLIDGDIVLMNRQPTLHRPSIMAHYIRIQPKDNIMRLNYVNCGTYNADFDGDEMNLHLPQSLFSRSEAKYIMDASRQYSVPKSGEPLRGLIQDSCIGGAFLTSKSTFLNREEYFHLLYTSLSFIFDKKSSALSTSPMIYSSQGQVIFGSNNRFSEVNSPLGKVKIDECILRNQSNLNSNVQNSNFEIEFSLDSLDTCIAPKNIPKNDSSCKTDFKIHSNIHNSHIFNNLILEPPTIIKPIHLWTGKQVFTSLLKTLLYNLVSTEPSVYAGINLISKSRTPGDSWNGKEDGENEEAVVIIRNSELLQGVIDKNQIGSNSYCLVHLCTELVGPLIGGKLLSAIFNLSQVYLQMRGFTCSISDMLLTPQAESERIELIKKYNHASVFIQEAFQYYIFKEIGGKNDLNNQTYFSEKFDIYKGLNSNNEFEKTKKAILELRDLKKEKYSSKISKEGQKNDNYLEINPSELVDFSDNKNLTSTVLDVLIDTIKNFSENSNNKLEKKLLLLELVKSLKQQRLSIDGLFKVEENPDRFTHDASGILFPKDVCTNNSSKDSDPSKDFYSNNDAILYDGSWLSIGKMEESIEDKFDDEENEFNNHGDFFAYPNELTRRKLESLIGNKLNTKKDSLLKIIDAISKIGLGDITSKLGNLLKGSSSKFPFPYNGFSSMVLTGAKGSRVNYNMICVMLGQQELEGRRVPIMPSMKTLPSFATYDLGSRAGGLITDRYLDGLHAQEFFFHCMSGREGLVDTAVKTARSGYLQRCILKGLESMIVNYDGTVRSEDDTIVQFIYGDDGIDVSKSSYLSKLEDLVRNKTLLERDVKFEESMGNKFLTNSFKNVFKYENRQNLFKTCLNQDILSDEKSFKKVKKSVEKDCFDNLNISDNNKTNAIDVENISSTSLNEMTVNSLLPTILNGGSVSELFLNSLSETNIQKLTRISSDSKYYSDNNYSFKGKRKSRNSLVNNKYSAEEYESMLNMEKLLRLKYMKTQISPGEAVGCLAAQSIGEPATQMTLNTFHLAGHGAANVTLGIPRLKELLQTGGDSKTPYIFIPLLKDINLKKDKSSKFADEENDNKDFINYAEKVLDCFKSIPLSDIIENVGVESSIVYDEDGKFKSSHKKSAYCWNYEISIQFSDLEVFCQSLPHYNMSSLMNLTLSKCIKPFLRNVNNMYTISSIRSSKFSNQDNDETDEFVSKYVLGHNSDRNIGIFKGALNSMIQKGNFSFGGGGGGEGELGQYEDDFDGGSRSDRKKEPKSEDDSGNNTKKEEIDDADNDMNNEMDGDDKDKNDDDDNSSVESSSSTSEEENGKDDSDEETEMNNGKFTEEANENDESGSEEDGDLVRRSLNGRNNFTGENLTENDSKIPCINLKILTKDVLKHVIDFNIGRKTNILSIKLGWPVIRCPHYIDFLPVLKNCILRTNIQSISCLKNARITRNQKETSDKSLSQFEVTVEGTNVGHVFKISPRYINHDKIRFNDIQTVYKYYGVEAARHCIINELRNVFSVYGINVDYRHLTLISDSITASGKLRVFNRMGTISYNISPFLQMSFETSMKFLTEACLRGALDNLKSPASSISVGKMVSVGTGISRTYTNFYQNSFGGKRKDKDGSIQKKIKDKKEKNDDETKKGKKTSKKEIESYFKFL
ncbi:DNA-directed RNA polymerase subunit [Cryptosporidium hominis]|uniref:DNA-directed RNA polymerase subunit n=3 Tax=Cryptosporidium hominis TaxID=237895 RepID=A0ABX5BAS2_CRYHO|nr:DNA-directed RNA polymerase subunit [Cryptosporidium hominis]|eukprot:PPS94198.1 DNA-directed RNA polymerase subunit [Cryptosporidium hominis]